MLIFILGYMGSGKTTSGRKLADRLGYRFYDLDEIIQSSTGYRIADYFVKFGEPSFRTKERELLISLSGETDTVIATGGGTPCFFDNMELMNSRGVTVYFDPGIGKILERLSDKINDRPLLKNIPPDQLPDFIRDHLRSRKVFYDRATIRIGGEDPDLEGLIKILHNFTANKPILNNE